MMTMSPHHGWRVAPMGRPGHRGAAGLWTDGCIETCSSRRGVTPHPQRRGRCGARSVRRPDARTPPAATADCHETRPAASRQKVSGSISTTAAGVPLVWRGPSMHCTAANGGTRTSTLRPGARHPSTSASARVETCRHGPRHRRPVTVDRAHQVVAVHCQLDATRPQEVDPPDRATPRRHYRVAFHRLQRPLGLLSRRVDRVEERVAHRHITGVLVDALGDVGVGGKVVAHAQRSFVDDLTGRRHDRVGHQTEVRHELTKGPAVDGARRRPVVDGVTPLAGQRPLVEVGRGNLVARRSPPLVEEPRGRCPRSPRAARPAPR